MYTFARTSLRAGLIFGTLLTAVGGWIRYGGSTGTPSYGVLLFGQILQAIAQVSVQRARMAANPLV